MIKIAEVKDGESTDPAAGVSILLPRRAVTNVLGRGHVSTRIVWVRLAGPMCNLFIAVVYSNAYLTKVRRRIQRRKTQCNN